VCTSCGMPTFGACKLKVAHARASQGSRVANRRQLGQSWKGCYEWQNPSYNNTGTLATERVTTIGDIAKQARKCAEMDFQDKVG